MKPFLTKNKISNLLFVLALVVLLYPPSREWFMRQIAFSPSINLEGNKTIDTYDWELKGLNTSNINLKQMKGEIIFVNFWATWCPPCRAEMPMIQNLFDDYKENVNFIFVTNENWTKVETFFEKNKYNLPVYNSVSLAPQLFLETNSIPASYLIDSNGNIVIDKVGAADWNSDKVRELLDNLLKEKNLK